VEERVKVRLYVRVQLSDGNRQYVDPVCAANGKLKPLYAVVDGKPEHHPEGVYHLRYLENGKRIWESVGTDAPSALTARLKKERTLGAKEAGVIVVEDEAERGRDLTEAVAEYLREVKNGKSRKTHLAYGIALREFCTVCKSQTVESLNRQDVLTYMGALKDRGMTPRTIANRLSFLKTFFLHFKQAWPMLKTDRVKYTEKTAEAYSAEDLQRLFEAANQEETELFQFLLCKGVREQEPASDATATAGCSCRRMDIGGRMKGPVHIFAFISPILFLC
jgi:hypothetical protein